MMRSRFHEELKRIAGRGRVERGDDDRLLNLATTITTQAGPVDLSAGLPSRIGFTPKPPSVTPEYFEDAVAQFHAIADEAVRRQVARYVAGANIVVAAIKGGISRDPTALLDVVSSVVALMDGGGVGMPEVPKAGPA